MNSFWDDFLEWLEMSFDKHPLWTITFGGLCALAGAIIF